jgi:dihydropyrimidinase
MYLTYPAMMISDGPVYEALCALRELGAIAGVHCENAGVIDSLIAARKAAGELGPASHPLCRPALAEAEAVGRLLKLAALADAPVVTVHTTCVPALAEIAAARARGQKVYVETCPQYLLLEDRYYGLRDFEGARYVCAPPLRKPADQARLWQGLASGEIQTVNTDHCSFTLAQRDMGRGDFTRIPGGLPGVETRLALLYTYGVVAGRITKEKMVELLSANNAKLYGLWGRKGAIKEGFDADLVLYDPKGEHAVRAAELVTNVDYNPYEGFPLNGSIRQVWLRGRLCVENGTVLEEKSGTYLPRELPLLF